MGAPSLDHEFMQYWSKLTLVEKESLLNVAKNYVLLKEEESDLTEIRHNIIREEREKYLRGEGASYSWEEVKQMAIDKEKRNGL
ncbi:hypothetical protein [Longitalea arenae]|uniref:hypothetical protein n=1 Tax=Longitalea arenae TaxID=2812558 RepID=UPI00196786B0|nr:hypothetical protein [Longitalea arenae]